MKKIKKVLGILLVMYFMMNVSVVHAEEYVSAKTVDNIKIEKNEEKLLEIDVENEQIPQDEVEFVETQETDKIKTEDVMSKKQKNFLDENSVERFNDDFLLYTDTCAAGKEQIYSFGVDFSVSSDVKIAAVRLGEGDVEIKVYDENGNQVKRLYLHSMDSLGYMDSKVWDTLEKPQGASGECVFTAKISTKTNSSFCFSVGSAKDLPNMLSGEDKITPMSKYRGFLQEGATNYQHVSNYIPGESNADYYQYVATEHNIVLLTSNNADLKFEIKNKDKPESVKPAI